MRSDEEGVATVVAVMLVLAILVTCIAVYSSTYVPGLKQQSEILHSGEVQFAFLRFSSDVENVYSLGKPVRFTEPVSLGGGDILLSPVRSSGTVELAETPVGILEVNGENVWINTTNVTYMPSYSSWEPQGYRYEKGVVWIEKGTKVTPAALSLYTVFQGKSLENLTCENRLDRMFRSLKLSGNEADMQIITMSTGENSFASGSGNVKLQLDAMEQKKIYPLSAGSSVTLRQYPSGKVVNSLSVAADTEFVLRILDVEVSVT